jgi:A/G-specific adenine glycosylase
MDNLIHKLVAWYNANKRDLPWRRTKDPYKIWLSEIILQQTRVAQGLSYYYKFIENYPTVTALAAASEHDVLKLWQGLGYYSRARNMHYAANYIAKQYKGKFPKDYESIRELKGVGDYTAAAISSFAYNLPHAVLDGNVMRVYSRLLGIKEPIDSLSGRKRLEEAARKLLPKENAGLYNQAIMEFGALCCLPKNPKCHDCPLQANCYAYGHKLVDKLPIKAGKTKQRERNLNYLVITNKGKILIRTRTEKDIWKGLHDFPCIETEKPLTHQDFLKTKEWKRLFSNSKPTIKAVSEPYTHILSHQKLKAIFIEIKLSKTIKQPKDCFWTDAEDIEKYAVPRLIERYIRNRF